MGTYKVQKILKEMKQFNNNEILIKGEKKEFEFTFGIHNLPHLLGLQYMDKSLRLKGFKLLNYTLENKLSDEEILEKVKNNFDENQMKKVKNRIDTFKDFMNNLEKGIIVEKTLEKGKMNINYLIVQSKNDDFYHLGILAGNNGTILEEFGQINKDVLRTYFVEDNIDYFEKTKIMEEVKEISRYSEDLEEYIPFSFDENKNRALIEEFKKGKEFDYKEFLKENFDNKEQIKSWNIKSKDKELER